MDPKKTALLAGLVLLLVLASGCLLDPKSAWVPRPAEPKYCEKVILQGNRDICFRTVASDTSNEMYCERVADLNQRDLCYCDLAIAQGGSKYCEKVTLQENKDGCSRAVASRTRNEAYCERIADLNQRELCYIDLAAGSFYYHNRDFDVRKRFGFDYDYRYNDQVNRDPANRHDSD